MFKGQAEKEQPTIKTEKATPVWCDKKLECLVSYKTSG